MTTPAGKVIRMRPVSYREVTLAGQGFALANDARIQLRFKKLQMVKLKQLVQFAPGIVPRKMDLELQTTVIGMQRCCFMCFSQRHKAADKRGSTKQFPVLQNLLLPVGVKVAETR